MSKSGHTYPWIQIIIMRNGYYLACNNWLFSLFWWSEPLKRWKCRVYKGWCRRIEMGYIILNTGINEKLKRVLRGYLEHSLDFIPYGNFLWSDRNSDWFNNKVMLLIQKKTTACKNLSQHSSPLSSGWHSTVPT